MRSIFTANKLSLLLWSLLICILAALNRDYVFNFLSQEPDENSFTERLTEPPPPTLFRSKYQNANLTVNFVGPEKCAECHADEHRSYELTAHSRTLQPLDIEDEPPGDEFDHEPSKRSYRIYRREDKMHHQEFLRRKDGTELILSDYPVDFLIGSGRHTRSYLVEIDGFLVQSPITWYESRHEWNMSPGGGYDVAQHWAFERQIDSRCTYCHAGRSEVKQESPGLLTFHTMALGCERCHGPGAIHVAKRSLEQKSTLSESEEDLTIVNPRHMTRDHQEAICAQCHLSGVAVAPVRGRELDDFRPGMRFMDFQINYEFESPDKVMTVTGHFDQMHLSRCYLESKTLTCTTCHNLHSSLEPAEKVDYYRSRCLTCHADQGCSLPREQRLRKSSRDDCITCHMPRAPTADIPHITFTHHWIGIHDGDDRSAAKESSDRLLKPIGDISHLEPIDQDRCLALAYMDLADREQEPAVRKNARKRAQSLLENVIERGLRDSKIEAALASCFRYEDPLRSIGYAKSALERENISADLRVEMLWIAGSASFDMQDTHTAVQFLEPLVHIHRNAEAWLLLAICYSRQGRFNDSLRAARRAAEISPWRVDLQEQLKHLYLLNRQSELAKTHAERASQLIELLPENTR